MPRQPRAVVMQVAEGSYRCAYHHRHLVKGWLSVEQHDIPILQVTLHLVAGLQVDITVFASVPQVKALTILSNDEASPSQAWRRMWTVLYQLFQPETA